MFAPVSFEGVLFRNKWIFFWQFMAVLCLLCVSFLSSLSPCSSQLGSFASVCVVSLPWGCKIPLHFCSPGTGSDLFSFFLCSNSDLWISTCFFSLALAHCHFSGSYWCTSTSGADSHRGEAQKLWVPDLLSGWNGTNRLDSVCQHCFYQDCEAGNVKKNAGSPTFTLKAVHCLWKAWLVAWEI